jgi:3-hydroxy acid dehydrogenase / malonic semialdehyde reductase
VSLVCTRHYYSANPSERGCEPLTPDDVAEVVVFAVGRKENVVVADTLVFPNHQVCGMLLNCGSSSI